MYVSVVRIRCPLIGPPNGSGSVTQPGRAISNFEFRISNFPPIRPKNHRGTEKHRGQHRVFLGPDLVATVTGLLTRGLNPHFGAYSRRGAVEEGLVAGRVLGIGY
jgi:hypothetical protein